MLVKETGARFQGIWRPGRFLAICHPGSRAHAALCHPLGPPLSGVFGRTRVGFGGRSDEGEESFCPWIPNVGESGV